MINEHDFQPKPTKTFAWGHKHGYCDVTWKTLYSKEYLHAAISYTLSDIAGLNFFLSGSTHESASCVSSHNLHDHGLEHKYKSERDKNIKQKKKNLNVM